MSLSPMLCLQVFVIFIMQSNCLSQIIETSNGEISFFPNENKTHYEAFLECRSKNLQLVEILSNDTSTAINKRLTEWLSNVGYWTGGYHINGTWLWSSGIPIQYSDWSKYQPVWSIPQNCVSIGVDRKKEWSKMPCHVKMGYACQSGPRTPFIASIEVDNCTGDFTIHWKPSVAVHSFRIVIRPADGGAGLVINQTIEVRTNNTRHFIGSDLTPGTMYNVTITPCPSTCRYDQSVVDTFTSGKVETIYAQLKKSDDRTCSGQILYFPRQKSIQNFTLMIYERPRLTSQTWDHIAPNRVTAEKVITRPVDSSSPILFSIHMYPNRKYWVEVRAADCSVMELSIEASGSCERMSTAPSYVPLPSVESDGSKITAIIYPIDEINGPASCYFVLLTAFSSSDDLKPNGSLPDEDLLNQAKLASSVMNKPRENVTYIAAAISSANVLISYDGIVLGDNTTSECNAMWISRKINFSSNDLMMFRGRNFPLLTNMSYRMRVIAAIPETETSILYKSSPELKFFWETKKTNSSDRHETLTISLTCGIIGAIFVFVTLFLVIKRRESLPCKKVDAVQHNSIDPFHSAPTIPSPAVANGLQQSANSHQGHFDSVHGYVKMAPLTQQYLNTSAQQRNSRDVYVIPIDRSGYYDHGSIPVSNVASNNDHSNRQHYSIPYEGNNEAQYDTVEYFTTG